MKKIMASIVIIYVMGFLVARKSFARLKRRVVT
jgi:hypothetical protein